MKKMVAFLLMVTLVFSVGAPAAYAAVQINDYYMGGLVSPTEQVQGNNVMVLHAETDTVVYQKNETQQLDPGALVKIMTAMLILEYVNGDELDKKITCDADIMNDSGWTAKGAPVSQLVAGEQVSIRDLIATMMVQSACDTSVVLARYIGKTYLGGDETTFLAAMNTRAKELGCENTNFVNVHGLSQENQYSTAADLMKIIKYAVTLPDFMTLCSPNYYEIEPTNMHQSSISVYGSNLMSSAISEYYYRKSKNIRIGRTQDNGQHLASYASNGTSTYLLLDLNAPYENSDGNATYAIYQDAEMLFDWAFETFKKRTVLTKGDVTCGAEIKVSISAGKSYTLAVPEAEVEVLLPSDLDVDSLLRVPMVAESVEAPVEKQEVLGTLQIQADDVVIATQNLVSTETIEQSIPKFIFSRVGMFFSSTPVKVILMLLVGVLVAFVLYTIDHNRRRQQQRLTKKRRTKR